ncbi:MAG TPA: TerC family protein [Usitatibacteraceae bacterium]|nr:TerC family protein [Usitatibacteraceae bacterium]
MTPSDPLFWTALAKIIGVNIILSGDNAVVIALAARSLPAKQQKMAIFWGSGAAIVMRVVLTLFAVALLQMPWLKLVGSVLLLWIGVKLLTDEDDGGGHVDAHDSLLAAIKTILVADLVMSIDNVIAVAAAAKSSTLLLVIGLAISIPLIIYASTLLIKLMERFPVIITIGAALIGWVAGEMAWEEEVIRPFTQHFPRWFEYVSASACALLVVFGGKWLARRQAASTAAKAEAS